MAFQIPDGCSQPTRRALIQQVAAGACAVGGTVRAAESGDEARWLVAQQWVKYRNKPVIALGKPGEFDDTHIFAPWVVRENGKYVMWYPGSQNAVAKRYYRLGLATSDDGVEFQKAPRPVFGFEDGRLSVLTPCVLRETDGTPVRENGKLRMWFTGADLMTRGGAWDLYEASGSSPADWGRPSERLLKSCYAPTVVKEENGYRMWFVDVSRRPWAIRHASSKDGTNWTPTSTASLVVDQAWEAHSLVYPHVVRHDGLYLMWYGSYWFEHEDAVRWPTTAIGFATSRDGLSWQKFSGNPVMRPDADLSWESHYNTSHCVIRAADGTWRMWYAGRTKPPFINKYLSIATATWKPPS